MVNNELEKRTFAGSLAEPGRPTREPSLAEV